MAKQSVLTSPPSDFGAHSGFRIATLWIHFITLVSTFPWFSTAPGMPFFFFNIPYFFGTLIQNFMPLLPMFTHSCCFSMDLLVH